MFCAVEIPKLGMQIIYWGLSRAGVSVERCLSHEEKVGAVQEHQGGPH